MSMSPFSFFVPTFLNEFLHNSSIKHVDLILKKKTSYFILKLQINNLSTFISHMNPKLKLQSHINLELYGDKMLVLSTRNEILNLKMCLTDGLWPSSITTQYSLIFFSQAGAPVPL